MDITYQISLTVFLPTLVAILLSIVPKRNDELIKIISLVTTIVTFGLVIGFLMVPFDLEEPGIQETFTVGWIPSFSIDYFMGLDGISLPLVVLTGFVCVLAMLASWSITKHVKAYCMLFLLLETGMLGVFMALDFFLFYVFWEVMLLPMYFLIGIWGGPRKEYAAIKFFLYTLFGSVLMLIAILMLYFSSDLVTLAGQSGVDLASYHLNENVVAAVEQAVADGSTAKIHTFNIPALAAMGQKTELFNEVLVFGWSLQHWAFLLLFIGFLIKVPSVPVHTWLPDAHVEAPTPISMILAGVLLKMGGYGIIRICYPICPHAGFDFAYFVCSLGVISMVYGALAALAQTDFKRMVAYSSVSHMGYVVLGLGVWSANAETLFDPVSWNMGIKGAMFQMIGHGVSSAGMFFMVGVIYDRVHHRNLNEFGGLYGRMPVYTAFAMVIFFAGLGLPGLCGFIGEVFVVLSVWKYSYLLAIISASVVILTAGYILWAIQRVYLGPEYKGPHGDEIRPITVREGFVASVLCFFAVLFGVFPNTVFQYMDKTINHQVDTLAAWTQEVKIPAEREKKEREEAESDTTADAAEPADLLPVTQNELIPVPTDNELSFTRVDGKTRS